MWIFSSSPSFSHLLFLNRGSTPNPIAHTHTWGALFSPEQGIVLFAESKTEDPDQDLSKLSHVEQDSSDAGGVVDTPAAAASKEPVVVEAGGGGGGKHDGGVRGGMLLLPLRHR